MRRPRRSALLSGLTALVLVTVLAPGAAKACSCVPPDMIFESIGDPDGGSAVFSGLVGPAVGAHVPVQVIEWFGGPPPAAVVSLTIDSAETSSCGTTAPPPGRQFLFLSYEIGDGTYGLNLCSPAADLATVDGQGMRDQVIAKLGPPFGVATAPPEPTAPTTTIFGMAVDPGQIVVFGGALTLAVVLVGGLFAIAERRRKAEKD